jgi:hemin uptake protein HemP
MGGLQGEGRIGGHMDLRMGNAHAPQLLKGLLIPDGDQGALLDDPAHQSAVEGLFDGADAVGIDHHGFAQKLRQTHDRQIVQKRQGRGGVLQQTAAAAEEDVTFLQSTEKCLRGEPGLGVQTVLAAGVLRIARQDGELNGHGKPAEHGGNGVEDGIIPQVAKAIIAGNGDFDGLLLFQGRLWNVHWHTSENVHKLLVL